LCISSAPRTQFVNGNLFNKGSSVMILWRVQSFISLEALTM
jgi:hypothetical protein